MAQRLRIRSSQEVQKTLVQSTGWEDPAPPPGEGLAILIHGQRPAGLKAHGVTESLPRTLKKLK